MWRARSSAELLARRFQASLEEAVRGAATAAKGVPDHRDRYTVVLRKDVPEIGRAGDVVKVRHGHARNRLIPSKQAVPGTKKNIELYARQDQAELPEAPAEDAIAVLQREVDAVLKRLAASPVELKRAVVTKERDGVAQPTSQLAEVVSRAHVTEAVQKQKGVDLAEQLLFMDPITEVGEFDVPLRMLYPDGTPPTFRLKILAVNPSS